jgi:hypothetical protein
MVYSNTGMAARREIPAAAGNCFVYILLQQNTGTVAGIVANWPKKNKKLRFLFCLHFIGDKIQRTKEQKIFFFLFTS